MALSSSSLNSPVITNKMNTQRNNHQKFKAKVAYVPRQLSASPPKIRPTYGDDHLYSTPYTDDTTGKTLSSPVPDRKSISTAKNHRLSGRVTPCTLEAIQTCTSKGNETKVIEPKLKPTERMKYGWSNLTAAQKFGLKIFLIITVLILVCSAIILPSVLLLVVFKQNMQSSLTNLTASICASTTCIGQETPYQSSMTTVLYPFDGNANDISGYAIGTVFGSSSPGFTVNSMVGGRAIVMNTPTFQTQYVQIPYINLVQRSFTIEAWIYPVSLGSSVDYGIFGQCDTNDNCIALGLRNSRLIFSIDSLNVNNITLVGTILISNVNPAWVHIAAVYDAALFQQRLYVSGRVDAISRSLVAPYRGTSFGSSTTIGRSRWLAYGTTYFSGRLDHVTISAGSARTACQILNDAVLIAYYPFNSNGILNDYSANLNHGISSDLTLISNGRIGPAIYFSSNQSYFQSKTFASVRNVTMSSFSISLWINPDDPLTGGTLVRASDVQNGSGSICLDILAFTSAGNLIFQWLQTSSLVNSTLGPAIPTNTWTHIALTYTSGNGMRLFINGQSTATTSNSVGLPWFSDSEPGYITLGNIGPLGATAPPVCRNGTIPYSPGVFLGSIDEYRFYVRELDNQEICVLADL